MKPVDGPSIVADNSDTDTANETYATEEAVPMVDKNNDGIDGNVENDSNKKVQPSEIVKESQEKEKETETKQVQIKENTPKKEMENIKAKEKEKETEKEKNNDKEDDVETRQRKHSETYQKKLAKMERKRKKRAKSRKKKAKKAKEHMTSMQEEIKKQQEKEQADELELKKIAKLKQKSRERQAKSPRRGNGKNEDDGVMNLDSLLSSKLENIGNTNYDSDVFSDTASDVFESDMESELGDDVELSRETSISSSFSVDLRNEIPEDVPRRSFMNKKTDWQDTMSNSTFDVYMQLRAKAANQNDAFENDEALNEAHESAKKDEPLLVESSLIKTPSEISLIPPDDDDEDDYGDILTRMSRSAPNLLKGIDSPRGKDAAGNDVFDNSADNIGNDENEDEKEKEKEKEKEEDKTEKKKKKDKEKENDKEDKDTEEKKDEKSSKLKKQRSSKLLTQKERKMWGKERRKRHKELKKRTKQNMQHYGGNMKQQTLVSMYREQFRLQKKLEILRKRKLAEKKEQTRPKADFLVTDQSKKIQEVLEYCFSETNRYTGIGSFGSNGELGIEFTVTHPCDKNGVLHYIREINFHRNRTVVGEGRIWVDHIWTGEEWVQVVKARFEDDHKGVTTVLEFNSHENDLDYAHSFFQGTCNRYPSELDPNNPNTKLIMHKGVFDFICSSTRRRKIRRHSVNVAEFLDMDNVMGNSSDDDGNESAYTTGKDNDNGDDDDEPMYIKKISSYGTVIDRIMNSSTNVGAQEIFNDDAMKQVEKVREQKEAEKKAKEMGVDLNTLQKENENKDDDDDD